MSSPRIFQLAGIGGGLCVLCVAAFAALKYRAERRLFFPDQQRTYLPAQSSGLAGAIDIEFAADSARLRGWYVSPKNGALVIMCHGAGGNRATLKPEARALMNAGFGVLLFDWPGHGESTGTINWNEGERASLRAAIAWVSTEPQVSRDRLGAYGFSMGGYIVSQVAAEDTRLRAVVLAGTPSDQRQQVAFQNGRLGFLGEWPALYALWRGGMRIELRRPIDEVKKITPRPLLVVGGSVDAIVSPVMAVELANSASQPEAAYVIEGAGHGHYVESGGNVYLERVVTFFRRALLTRAS